VLKLKAISLMIKLKLHDLKSKEPRSKSIMLKLGLKLNFKSMLKLKLSAYVPSSKMFRIGMSCIALEQSKRGWHQRGSTGRGRSC
jgi:hypothetical protein